MRSSAHNRRAFLFKNFAARADTRTWEAKGMVTMRMSGTMGLLMAVVGLSVPTAATAAVLAGETGGYKGIP